MSRRSQIFHRACYIRNAVGILAAVLVFGGITCALNYMYANSEETVYERVIWHDFYENDGSIDRLYLGSSHVFCDLDPKLLDQLNGKNNFNLASVAQLMNGSYYLLREADRKNQLQAVYLELHYGCTTKDNFNFNAEGINTDGYKNWWNIDYMKMSFNKMKYMFSNTSPDEYVNVFFPFCRYREKLNDGEYIRKVIEVKGSDSYAAYECYYNYEDDGWYEEYMGKGFFKATKKMTDDDRRCTQARVLDRNPMGTETLKYLYKIIDYCKEREIPIILFISPTTDLDLISTENYDNYTEQIRAVAKEYGVPFYDFNLAREEYLPIQHNEYYRDIGHLNGFGAELFTSFFHEVVSREESENEKYFYDSYDEKMQTQMPMVHGIYYRYSEKPISESPASEESVRKLWIASNRDSGMEYRIILTPTGGEQYMVQDFNENKEFKVPWDEHGTCTVVYRMQEEKDEVQTIEVAY